MLRSLLALSLLACAPAFGQDVVPQMHTRIFVMETPNVPEVHASTIVELDKDRLMAAWFGGTQEGKKDVGIWTSVYQDGAWSQPVEIVNGVVNENLRYPSWNPVLFKTKAGKLFLYYKVGPNPREWWGMMMYSTNNGKSWSKPERLPGTMLGPIKNKPFQLENGDILYPTSTESVDKNIWKIHLEKSDKNGRNWTHIDIPNDTFQAIQPSILRYGHDSLQLLCRSKNNVVVQSWSADNGKTWSPVTATSLPNPNSGTDALTLANGYKLIVFNPTQRGDKWSDGRAKLYVAISRDGQEWKNVGILENGDKGEYSYPAVIQGKDGRIHITYTADRKNIRYVMMRLEPLTRE